MGFKRQHRDKLTILAAILGYINEVGYAKKTRILYATNLNLKTLDKFLGHLLGIGAVNIVETDEGPRYALTRKGRSLLKYIHDLEKALCTEPAETSNMAGEEAIEKAISATQHKYRDQITSVRIERIEGRSGQDYHVEVLDGVKDKYIVVPYEPDGLEPFTAQVCRALVYLIDTGAKCIIIVPKKSGARNYVESIMDELGIALNKYLVVEV